MPEEELVRLDNLDSFNEYLEGMVGVWMEKEGVGVCTDGDIPIKISIDGKLYDIKALGIASKKIGALNMGHAIVIIGELPE